MSGFAFLLGIWSGPAELRRKEWTCETFDAHWMGRYILDGYAIADEFRMTTPEGRLLVLGINLRSCHAPRTTPDKQMEAVKIVLEQTEHISNLWAA